MCCEACRGDCFVKSIHRIHYRPSGRSPPAHIPRPVCGSGRAVLPKSLAAALGRGFPDRDDPGLGIVFETRFGRSASGTTRAAASLLARTRSFFLGTLSFWEELDAADPKTAPATPTGSWRQPPVRFPVRTTSVTALSSVRKGAGGMGGGGFPALHRQTGGGSLSRL